MIEFLIAVILLPIASVAAFFTVGFVKACFKKKP